MAETTTIEIQVHTWKQLNERKPEPSATYDDVIRSLLKEEATA